MVNLVPNFVREIWDIWNICGLVLTSFALQVCLLLFAPLRKCTNKSIVTWFLWSAYLLANYVAIFCIGLIFHKRDTFFDNSVNSYILVFWAPFLLLHLGGPDTITAFALEDNELWLRHLLVLVFQVATTVYLFFLTIPGNTLWIPTTLLFVAGLIKYIERTRSLFLASKNTLRKSCRDPELAEEISLPNNLGKGLELYYENLQNLQLEERPTCSLEVEEPIDDIEYHVKLLQHGFSNFNIFKRLFVDKTLDFEIDREHLREFFPRIDPVTALTLTELELNFMYEFFFTKASMLWNKVGCLLRIVSIISTVAALSVFVTDKERGFNKLEIEVTYVLLFGAVALDTTLLLRLIISDRSIITCSQRQSSEAPDKLITKLANNLKANLSKVVLIPSLKFRKPKWSICKKEPYTKLHSLSTSLLFRKWSGTISGHDFITYCLHKTEGRQSSGELSRVVVKFLKQTVHQIIDCFGAEELVETWIYKKNNPFLKELWEFIFMELDTKSRFAGDNKENVDMICEATGEWILQEGELAQRKKVELMPYVNSDEVGSFGERIMIWHIATGLCYYAYSEADQKYANDDAYSEADQNRHAYSEVDQNYADDDAYSEADQNYTDADQNYADDDAYFEADQNYAHDDAYSDAHDDHRCFSKLLSDYMLYLLVMEPNVISVAAGIDRGTIQDTIDRVKNYLVAAWGKVSKFRGIQNQERFAQSACEAMINTFPGIESDRKNKLLIHAFDLAIALKAILPERGWKTVAQIWVEMLSYVALNTKPDMHVQQLSKGGQLISLVWLLMLHMGLGGHRLQKIRRSYARPDYPSEPPLWRSISLP